MSRIGLGYNITQPDKRCLNCKYWESARNYGFLKGFVENGHCKPGYCKKDFHQTHTKNKRR